MLLELFALFTPAWIALGASQKAIRRFKVRNKACPLPVSLDPKKPFFRVSSRFGKRKSPTSGASSQHNGIDLATFGQSLPVFAYRKGKVTFASYTSGGAGGLIEIEHEDGEVSQYMHLLAFRVATGQEVEAGQTIADSGGGANDVGHGTSTGRHLHFGRYKRDKNGNKVFIDPEPDLNAVIEKERKELEAAQNG